METSCQLPSALAEVISPEKQGSINKHGIPGRRGGRAAQPALSLSLRWPINFSSQALGPENLPALPTYQAPFSFPFLLLPSKSVADPPPWELELVGAAQSSLLAQHHMGFPRKCLQFPGQFWWKVEFFLYRLPESSESTGCSEGATAAAGL